MPNPVPTPEPSCNDAQARARLLAALDHPVDVADLSRAVLTRLAGPAPRDWRFAPALAIGAYAILALAFGLGGYQASVGLMAGQGAGPDPVLDLAMGGLTGALSGVWQ